MARIGWSNFVIWQCSLRQRNFRMFGGKPSEGTIAFAIDKKMIIEFDSKNEKLSLVTKTGNNIVLDDKKSEITIYDKNKNKIKISKEGVDIISGKNLNIESNGDINIISKSKINLIANSNIVLKGSNISNNAKVKFSANGSAGSEIKSSAVTDIKGTIVKIN